MFQIMKSIAFAALLFLAPMTATLADDAAAPAATSEVPASNTCKKPLLPSKLRKADDTSDFQEKVDTYHACIKTYADLQGELAKKHVAAANAAIKELNDFVSEVNEAQTSK
jgi:hypothetical protein